MNLSSKKQKHSLYSIIFLNLLACFCSCLTESSIAKMKISVGQFCLDFFITTWCVGNSVLTIIYCLREINYHNKQKTGNSRFAFHSVVAVSNLITGITFTCILLSGAGLTNTGFKTGGRPGGGYVYIAIWHYVAPALALFYFFKLAKIKKQTAKGTKLFLTISCFPVLYLGTNFIRVYSIDPIYLTKPFKKFFLPYFNGLEEGKHGKLLGFLLLQILFLCLIAYFLIKLKEKFFPHTVSNSNSLLASTHVKPKQNVNPVKN